MALVSRADACGDTGTRGVMGMGPLGGNNVIFKRKFRWGLRVEICPQTNPQIIHEHFVKVAARPNITIEATEINMKNAKTWIPGKAEWQTITITYYDVAGTDVNNGILALYQWLRSVYDFTTGIQGDSVFERDLTMGSSRQDYAGLATLNMYDGCGNVLETWKFKDAWPEAIDFGELEMSNAEEATINLTMRYSDVQYCPGCGVKPPKCSCTNCGPGTTGSGVSNIPQGIDAGAAAGLA
jgi:hypothetical protein